MNLDTEHRSEGLTYRDREFIRAAARSLEHPGRVVEVLDRIGRPAEALMKRIPDWAREMIEQAVQSSLLRATEWAVKSLGDGVDHRGRSHSRTAAPSSITARGAIHTVAAAALGGIGGALGVAALPIELPITTMVILRSIGAIARDFDADLDDPATRLECISVLSLGGPSENDDAMESSYLTSRVGLAMLVQDASRYLGGRSAAEAMEAAARGAAPEMFQLVSKVGQRFGLAATDLAYAQMVPIAGAVGGAALNAYFANFFNRVAFYHFGLRRLERIHGEDTIQQAYQEQMNRM